MKFDTIEQAIEDVKAGKMIVIVDDDDQRSKGDLMMAAEKITPQDIGFMATNAKGIICAPVTQKRARDLGLFLMVEGERDGMQPAYTVSVDKKGIGSGISANARAITIKALSDASLTRDDFKRPGFVFPLIAKEGGVLKRAGNTEAAVDLAKLAGLTPAGVICQVLDDSGEVMLLNGLEKFAQDHDLSIISVADLIKHRRVSDKHVTMAAKAKMQTEYGNFEIIAFENSLSGEHHVALVMGDIENQDEPVLVRVHSECLTGDAFHSLRCDCGQQLNAALAQIGREGRGVLLYMRQEGRGIGLVNKIKAYSLQDKGLDTVEANVELGFDPDLRDYGVGAQILYSLGIRKMRLLTNNPTKVVGLSGYGLEVVERVQIEFDPNENNAFYMQTKKEKMGHFLEKSGVILNTMEHQEG